MSLIYKNCMGTIGKFVPENLQPVWKHPAGPQTVFFWAPLVKWGLVIAGLGDLQRSADQISISQTVALGTTGIIWSRYSLVITPKNWGLVSVNVFVACTALYQLSRVVRYRREQAAKKLTLTSVQ